MLRKIWQSKSVRFVYRICFVYRIRWLLYTLLGLYVLLRFSPYPALERFQARPYSSIIRDRNDTIIAYGTLEHGLLRLHTPEIPKMLEQIFLLSEDQRFYRHLGVDLLAVARATRQYVKHGRIVSGASTISMQLVDMLQPESSRPNFANKLLEMLNALRLETRLSKKEILAMWLNNLPFGAQNEGIESAAFAYYQKTASQLSPAEALVLAILPRAPSLYSPLDNPEGAAEQANLLLQRLQQENAFLQLKRADIEAAIAAAQPRQLPRKAPHFTQFLKSRPEFDGGDYRSSLDLEQNQEATNMLRQLVEQNEDRRIRTGAFIALDNRSGEILLYQGSANFADKEAHGEIDGVQVQNQPGSTLKPFLYSLAIEMGFLPNTLLADIPSEYGGEQVYIPSNYNQRFNGPVRLRVALASSLNVPAISTLHRLGVQNFVQFLLRSGFDSLKPQADQVGLGLALGNGQVTLLELTRAFSIFTRDGYTLQLQSRKGHKQSKRKPDSQRVLSEYSARIITNILADQDSRRLGFSNRAIIHRPYDFIMKTGTSNQFQNIWSLMATPNFTVGVWMGSFEGSTVIGETGSSLPTQEALFILDKLEAGRRARGFEYASWPKPSQNRQRICTLSGEGASPFTQNTVWEYLPEGLVLKACSFHTGRGRPPRYPVEYAHWLASANVPGTIAYGEELQIVRPNNKAQFYLLPDVPQEFQAVLLEATSGISSTDLLDLFIDGRPYATLQAPYRIVLPMAELGRGQWTLELRSQTTGQSDEVEIQIH